VDARAWWAGLCLPCTAAIREAAGEEIPTLKNFLQSNPVFLLAGRYEMCLESAVICPFPLKMLTLKQKNHSQKYTLLSETRGFDSNYDFAIKAALAKCFGIC